MAIVLGNYSFDEGRVSVAERQEEVGGRDGRVIVLKGMTPALASVAAVEAALDAILAAASDGAPVALSLRAGRRMWVTRSDFAREVARGSRVGSFALTLTAEVPWEESEAETVQTWSVSASGTGQGLAAAGNTWTPPRVTLTAADDLVCPELSDGDRSLVYPGVVEKGAVIVFDGAAEVITLDGEDVTPYGEGTFPRITPEGVTLTFRDDVTSSHMALVEAAWRDRWW